MPDNLNIYGQIYPDAAGIKAKDTNGNTLTFYRPQGTKSIIENGQGIDVASYASVNVNVPSSSGTYQQKTVNPTEQQQAITPDTGYDALSQITVNGISNTYVGSGITRRSSSDLTTSGATVSVPSGYYESNASGTIQSGTEGVPVATKGTVSNHSVTVTPSVTNTAGYISGGTHSGTSVAIAASELVSGSTTFTDDGTYDVTNYASAEVDYDIFNHLRYVTFVNNTSKSLTLYVLTKMSNGRIANRTVILQSQASTSQYFLVGTSVFEIRSTISNGNYSISYTDSSSSGSAKLVAEKAFNTTTWIKIIELSATFSMADGVITFTDSSDPFPEEVITEPLSVNVNGTYTAPSGTAYSSVEVAVPTPTPSLQTKSVSPSETAQTVTPDSGYDGLSQVSVGAISNTYVGSGIDRNDSTDLTASGATVTVPAGYYENSATKAITSGTEGTPTATKGTVSSHSITITPSVTNTAGYIAGGTKSGTGVNVTASELVSGTKSITENGTGIDVTNYASVDVSVSSKHTATITKAGHHDERGDLYSEIRYNGAYYYSLNSTFQFTPGDTATIYVRLYNSGPIIIDIDGNTVVNTTAQWYSYSYTLPNNDINIELDYSKGSHIYVMNSAMTPLTVTQNGTYIAPSGTGYTPVTVNVPTPAPSLQTKSISPSETAQTVTPDSGYDGLSQVSISAVSSTYVGSGITSRSSTDLTASGSVITAPAGYYSASASKAVAAGSVAVPDKTITANPTISVSTAGVITASVAGSSNVSPTVTAGYVTSGTQGTMSVSGSSTFSLTTQAAATITPSESQQTAVASQRYTTGNVMVAAISANYIGSSVTRRSSADLTASGSAITAPAGYYASAASKTVSAGTAGTPTATKGTVSNHSITVTPSVTNTTGWITGSTKTGTAVTVNASELVSGSSAISSNGTYDVTNYASAVVSINYVTYYTGRDAPSSALGQDGDIYLQL